MKIPNFRKKINNFKKLFLSFQSNCDNFEAKLIKQKIESEIDSKWLEQEESYMVRVLVFYMVNVLETYYFLKTENLLCPSLAKPFKRCYEASNQQRTKRKFTI